MEQLLEYRRAADSPTTRAASVQSQDELSQLQEGSGFERFVAWYYARVCSGYGYLIRTKGGIRSRRGWITPAMLMQHLGGKNDPQYLAIRPPTKWSNWACVDIDQGSPYHPGTDGGAGLTPVLNALSEIGLNKGLEIQSSSSGGLHLWFPLCEPIGTWKLAVAIEETCERNKLQVENGVLELRPNRKGYGTQYLAIRAPLSGEGNGLIVEGFGIVENHKAFMLQWSEAQIANHFKKVEEKKSSTIPSSNSRRRQKKKGGLNQAMKVLEVGFTGKSQTQRIKLAAMQKARLIEELDTESALRERSHQLIEEAPGYQEHCRHKHAIRNRSYISSSEIKKALRLIPSGYEGTWKEKANAKKKESAKNQAQAQIERMRQNNCVYKSRSEAFIAIKKNGGPSRAWWYKRENATYLRDLVERVRSCNKNGQVAS